MPPVARWAHRLNDVLKEIENIKSTVVYRVELQEILGVERRRAQQILRAAGGKSVSGMVFIEKDALLRYLNGGAYQPASKVPGFVYFAETIDGKHIKIGFTIDLKNRIKALRQASVSRYGVDCRYVAWTAGDTDLEREFHRHCEEDSEGNEWFRKTALLTGLIAGVLSNLDLSLLLTPLITLKVNQQSLPFEPLEFIQ